MRDFRNPLSQPLLALALLSSGCAQEGPPVEDSAAEATVATEPPAAAEPWRRPSRADVQFFIRDRRGNGFHTERALELINEHSTVVANHSVRHGDGPKYGARWRYLGRADGGDRYGVTCTVEHDSATRELGEKVVVYRGERLIVLQGEEWMIGAEPEREEDR